MKVHGTFKKIYIKTMQFYRITQMDIACLMAFTQYSHVGRGIVFNPTMLGKSCQTVAKDIVPMCIFH